MTMSFERKNAVNNTRYLLVDMLWGKYPEVKHDSKLWHEIRRCLKHYPWDYDMEMAAQQSPDVFGDLKKGSYL